MEVRAGKDGRREGKCGSIGLNLHFRLVFCTPFSLSEQMQQSRIIEAEKRGCRGLFLSCNGDV